MCVGGGGSVRVCVHVYECVVWVGRMCVCVVCEIRRCVWGEFVCGRVW